MSSLPEKVIPVFEKYESLTTDWSISDFESDIAKAYRNEVGYHVAKELIDLAKKSNIFPITVKAYNDKHKAIFSS